MTLFGSIPLQRTISPQGDWDFPAAQSVHDVRISTPDLNPACQWTSRLPTLPHQSGPGDRGQLRVAKEDLRAQRQSAVNDVKKAYFTVLQTQSALEATEESIKLP
jgi:hypothetical protein